MTQQQNYLDPFSKDYKIYDKGNIMSIEPADVKEHTWKTKLVDNVAYSNHRFVKGDIVEICPCKPINDNFPSDAIKEICFQTAENEYMIPLGHCQFYKIADERTMPNVDYIYDPNLKVICIRAIQNIEKDTPLVLSGK